MSFALHYNKNGGAEFDCFCAIFAFPREIGETLFLREKWNVREPREGDIKSGVFEKFRSLEQY